MCCSGPILWKAAEYLPSFRWLIGRHFSGAVRMTGNCNIPARGSPPLFIIALLVGLFICSCGPKPHQVHGQVLALQELGNFPVASAELVLADQSQVLAAIAPIKAESGLTTI